MFYCSFKKKSDFCQQISNRKAKNLKFFQDKVFFYIKKESPFNSEHIELRKKV